MLPLAPTLKQELDEIAVTYEQRLREIKGYAQLTDADRLDAAQYDLELITDCLEEKDDTSFVDFIRNKAGVRLGKDFDPETLLQVLTALEETLMPFVSTAEDAIFLWRTFSRALSAAAQRTVQMLQESEMQLRNLADNISVGVFIHREGELKYAGREGAKILGYPDPSELVGHSIMEFIHPEERERIANITLRRIAGEPVPNRYEARLITRDGSTLDVLLYSTLTKFEGETATQGAFIDITERKQMEQQIQDALDRRGRQVETSTEIAQQIAAAPALDELFNRVVDLIKERFGYYHTQIFRYEPALDAVVLVVGYGETGERMLEAGHHLELGHGVVGAAAATGHSIIASDVTKDPEWVPNPYLPETKGELAVPIKWQDEVLGILDVQSDTIGALTEEDQILLEGLCGQIAIAIQNTRLRQEMEENLHELERLARATSREGWEAFRSEMRSTPESSSGYMFDRTEVVPADDLWTPEIKAATRRQELVTPTADNGAATVAPLAVRGEIIGALGIEEDPNKPLSDEELALVEEFSEQVSLALESARLFEQTQTALAESDALYETSRSLITADRPEEMLEAISRPALDAGAKVATLFYVDVNSAGEPEWAEVVAQKQATEGPALPTGDRYHIPDFPLGHIMTADPQEPQLIDDIRIHEAVDEKAAQLLNSMEARAIAIIPLTLAERWQGIVSLSWSEPHEFSERERRLYSATAPQLATLIENQRLFAQTQQALEEVEAVHRLYLREQWEKFISTRATPIYERTKPNISTPDEGLPPEVAQALERGEVIVGSRKDGTIPEKGQNAIVAPLTLRGEVIGALGLQEPEGGREWTEEDIALVESVAEQLALAIENARLLEETQRRAQRDRMVADITSKVRASSDIETILQTAVRELGAAMDTDRARVQLKAESKKTGDGDYGEGQAANE
jgi:PAS domain S-box-containing protein